jgi:colanic acid biosynthesis glycosyl transferase WcaI
LEGLVVPSKAYGILAAGRPVIYVGPRGSEVARLLHETKAGVVIENGDSRALVSMLRELAAGVAARQAMGEAARRVAKEFTFAKALAKWHEVLA